jgi:sugar/nucleoside kinase (ribokinase family)
MHKVLYVGDINVDVMMGGLASFPVADKEITCESFDVVMGSSAVIAACAYAALGGKTAVCGLAGQDDHGDFMMRGLQEACIDISLVRRTTEVGTGVTVNLIQDRIRTQVTYPGTIEAFDGTGLDRSALADVDHVHFAGPYLQTRFRPRVTHVLEIAKDLGASTSLDPQWDPTGRWEFMEEWLPLLSYLFVNEDEAMSITGMVSAAQACQSLGERTACPVVKTGKDGALVLDDDRIESRPPIDVDVVDTTGAGDNFDAGFLFAVLEKKMNRVKACEFGNAVASRSCAFVGGTNAGSSYQDVMNLMETSR